jgi:hypothetical protein
MLVIIHLKIIRKAVSHLTIAVILMARIPYGAIPWTAIVGSTVPPYP